MPTKYGAAIAQGEPLQLDVRMRRADGRIRFMALQGTPRPDRMTMTLSAMDVSHAREGQRALQLLAAVGDELNSSRAIEEILEAVARVLVREIADLCTLSVLDDDGKLTRVAIGYQDKDVEPEIHAWLARRNRRSKDHLPSPRSCGRARCCTARSSTHPAPTSRGRRCRRAWPRRNRGR